MKTKINKTEFFKRHGHELVQVSHDDAEYGDFLILHPEEISKAKELEDKGMTIVSVYETEDSEDYIDFENPFDSADQLFKYGYFAINTINK